MSVFVIFYSPGRSFKRNFCECVLKTLVKYFVRDQNLKGEGFSERKVVQYIVDVCKTQPDFWSLFFFKLLFIFK